MPTDDQENSIDRQREQVEELAARKGYALAAESVDEGISRTEIRERKGLQRLLADASAGPSTSSSQVQDGGVIHIKGGRTVSLVSHGEPYNGRRRNPP